jgi:hypothetical protein
LICDERLAAPVQAFIVAFLFVYDITNTNLMPMLPWFTESPADRLVDVRDTRCPLVRDNMLALILKGELVPGQRINEPDVASRSASRVLVREACGAGEFRWWCRASIQAFCAPVVEPLKSATFTRCAACLDVLLSCAASLPDRGQRQALAAF